VLTNVSYTRPDDEKESKRLTPNPSTLKVRRTAGMSGCCLAEDTQSGLLTCYKETTMCRAWAEIKL